jgi:hypothetical protein
MLSLDPADAGEDRRRHKDLVGQARDTGPLTAIWDLRRDVDL